MNSENRKSIIYISDELSNFREIRTSGIARGILYRSSHPLQGGDITRAISRFARQAGINGVLNLDDDHAALPTKSTRALWYRKLVKAQQVIGLNMTLEIPSEYGNQKLKEGLRFIIAHKGPYLIHCFAGIDRTGFVAAVLEALMGASIREIVDDYLLSFGGGNTSAYTTDEWEIEDVYSEARILAQLSAINNGTEITGKTIQAAVEQYLLGALGLSTDELALLKQQLAPPRRPGEE